MCKGDCFRDVCIYVVLVCVLGWFAFVHVRLQVKPNGDNLIYLTLMNHVMQDHGSMIHKM